MKIYNTPLNTNFYSNKKLNNRNNINFQSNRNTFIREVMFISSIGASVPIMLISNYCSENEPKTLVDTKVDTTEVVMEKTESPILNQERTINYKDSLKIYKDSLAKTVQIYMDSIANIEKTTAKEVFATQEKSDIEKSSNEIADATGAKKDDFQTEKEKPAHASEQRIQTQNTKPAEYYDSCTKSTPPRQNYSKQNVQKAKSANNSAKKNQAFYIGVAQNLERHFLTGNVTYKNNTFYQERMDGILEYKPTGNNEWQITMMNGEKRTIKIIPKSNGDYQIQYTEPVPRFIPVRVGKIVIPISRTVEDTTTKTFSKDHRKINSR